jgi:hypothetical protein
MLLSKKNFLHSLTNFIFEGNGGRDIRVEDGAYIPEAVNSTFTRWIQEWVDEFNKINTGCRVELVIVGQEYGRPMYRIMPVKPEINQPKVFYTQDEFFEVDNSVASYLSRRAFTEKHE